MRHYYAVQFKSGTSTTTGQPNKTTGRLSIACDIQVFSKLADRDSWVENGETTSDMQGNCRETINASEVRGLCLGDTIDEMNEYLDFKLDIMINDMIDDD